MFTVQIKCIKGNIMGLKWNQLIKNQYSKWRVISCIDPRACVYLYMTLLILLQLGSITFSLQTFSIVKISSQLWTAHHIVPSKLTYSLLLLIPPTNHHLCMLHTFDPAIEEKMFFRPHPKQAPKRMHCCFTASDHKNCQSVSVWRSDAKESKESFF